MLESIKTLRESEPLLKLKNAVISGNNFRLSRYSSNEIASVIMIQQITHLIICWTENIICRDYRPVVPPAWWNWAVWQFRWSADRQMDWEKKKSEWEGNRQPPGLIRGGKKTPHPILLFWWLECKCRTCGHEQEACISHLSGRKTGWDAKQCRIYDTWLQRKEDYI